jgi:hypothetical protein
MLYSLDWCKTPHKGLFFNLVLLAYFRILEKNRVGLWDDVAVCVCVSVYPPIVARQRLGKNPLIVARKRLGKNLLIVARQRLGRNVTAGTNIHSTIEDLLDASFSMWPVSYQGKQAISSSQNFLFRLPFSNRCYIIFPFVRNIYAIVSTHVLEVQPILTCNLKRRETCLPARYVVTSFVCLLLYSNEWLLVCGMAVSRPGSSDMWRHAIC